MTEQWLNNTVDRVHGQLNVVHLVHTKTSTKQRRYKNISIAIMYFRNDIIGEKIVQRFHTMYLKNVSERVSQRISYNFCILFILTRR